MFAVSTYEEVIDHERFVENQEIVVLLFVKPTNQDAMDIVQEFEYIHYNSSKYCSIYAVGYSNDFQKQSDPHYKKRSEEHTSELQSRFDLHSFPTRRSSDLL